MTEPNVIIFEAVLVLTFYSSNKKAASFEQSITHLLTSHSSNASGSEHQLTTHYEHLILTSYLSMEKRLWGDIEPETARAYREQ